MVPHAKNGRKYSGKSLVWNWTVYWFANWDETGLRMVRRTFHPEPKPQA
jgi:hypothetical protein